MKKLFYFQIDRLPFNWKNPIGYGIAVALQISIVSYPLRYLACFFTLAFGAYLIGTTIAKHVVEDMKSTNDDIKFSKSKIDVFKKLSELIQMHSDAKQLNETRIDLLDTL